MEKINFEVGTMVTPAKVNEDKTIIPAVWEGTTPLSPFMLNKLQDNIENDQIKQNTAIDELKAKTIKCLQEVETPTPVSGTSIDLNDSAEAKINELKISGNSKQETREGYNLIGLEDGTYSHNGITAVVSNGEVTLNGTSTAIAFANIPLISDITLKQSTLYQMYAFNDTVTDDIYFRPNGNDGNRQVSFSSVNNVSGYQNNQTSVTLSYIMLRISNGVTLSNVKCKPMIIEGSDTTKEYEPYGASPSPDYPSEVECCGDNINIIEETFKGYNINSNGAFEVLSSFDIQIAKVKANVKYILNTNTNLLGYYDEKPTLSSITYDNSRVVLPNSTNTITPARNGYIAIRTNSLEKVKLEQGEVVTTYSPPGQGCINEVICNDNFFDKNNLISYTVISRSNGVATTNTTNSNYESYLATDFISVKENTNYFINFTYTSTNYGWCFYDKNKNFISGIEPNVKNFVTPNKTAYLRFCYNKNNINTNTIQLVEGSTEKPYVEHKEQVDTIPTQQPFRAIENYKDTFIKKNNKWYERHYIIREIFDGTENWKIANTGMNNQYCYLIIGTGLMIANSFICTHYTKEEMSTTTGQIRIKTELSLDNWKSYLAEQYANGTPVYVDYLLAEPLDLECTEEQSTILFEIEQNAKTYYKVTHIYSTDKISPVIDVTYKKDIETLFNNTLIEEVG